MATFEERILQFLDGERENGSPLDEPSREQLLREVSESPEKRRVFTAHLKLRDLLGIGRKPSPAPLDVQRDLAQKLPVLALHLPYLAEDPRKARTAGFWTSSSTMIRVAVVTGILAIGGGAWYLGSHSHSNSTHEISSTRLSPANPSSLPSPGNPLASSSARSSISSSAGAGSAGSTASRMMTPSFSSVSTDAANGAKLRVRQAERGRDNLFSSSTTLKLEPVTDDSKSGNRTVADEQERDGNLNQEHIAQERPLATIDRLSVRPATERPKISDINSTFTTLSTGALVDEALQNAEQAMRKTSFWAGPELRVLLLPHVTLSQPSTGAPLVSLSGPAVRFAYWASITRQLSNAGWSAGLRFGYLPLAQMQSVTYSEPTPNYPLLVRYRRETLLKDTVAIVIAPQVSYATPMFGGDAALSAFGGVGLAQLNWMAGLRASYAYPLSSKLSVQSAIAFDVTSVKAATEQNGNILNSYTLGVQDIQSVTKTLLSPSFGLSVGLSFRP